MSDGNELEYYRQRELSARERSAAAKSPSIAAIHNEMADRYAALIVAQVEADLRSSRPKHTA